MSLDVYLIKNLEPEIQEWQERKEISLLEAGSMKGLIPLIEEYYEDRHPKNKKEEDVLYWANITHNLSPMAKEAGIYTYLWRPEELKITIARELIEPLQRGFTELKSNPSRFESFNSINGWGIYSDFVSFVAGYLDACMKNPDAIIRVTR